MEWVAEKRAKWEAWIRENLEKQCTEVSMVQAMVASGVFTEEEAQHEIAALQPAKSIAPYPQPWINLAANTIQTKDRLISIRFSMQVPTVVLLDNVFSSEECDALVDYAQSELAPNTVIADDVGVGRRLHAGRTSYGMSIDRAKTPLIQTLEDRLGEIAHWPVTHAEGLQVLRYREKDQYTPHYDWFDPARPGPRENMSRGGQRTGTFVIYLSDVEAGGSTDFPKVRLKLHPQKGSAVFFTNTNKDGTGDSLTLHAGAPVVKGTKFICNKWLRERFY